MWLLYVFESWKTCFWSSISFICPICFPLCVSEVVCTVHDVYNVKLMKLWILSFCYFCFFVFCLMSVTPLSVCLCVCMFTSRGVALFSWTIQVYVIRKSPLSSTDIGNWQYKLDLWLLYSQWTKRGRKPYTAQPLVTCISYICTKIY